MLKNKPIKKSRDVIGFLLTMTNNPHSIEIIVNAIIVFIL